MDTNTPPQVVILNQQKTSGFCVTSMILGIVSILGGAVTIILPILAIIFGHLGYNKCKSEPQTTTGGGMGIAGLVMGYITLVGMILYIMFFTFAMFAVRTHVTSSIQKEQVERQTQINDVRQLIAAAEQVMIENGVSAVEVKIDRDGTVLSSPIKNYISRVSAGTTIVGEQIISGKKTTVHTRAGVQVYDENGYRE